MFLALGCKLIRVSVAIDFCVCMAPACAIEFNRSLLKMREVGGAFVEVRKCRAGVRAPCALA